mgnify:CR=1 FL=1
MRALGERLRELRRKKKLSQRNFGKLFGLSESAIGMYERNERKPDYETLEKFANYFDVSVDFLLGRVNTPSANNIPPKVELTEEDERDIAIRMAKLREDLIEGRDTGGLSYLGKQISEEAIESILASLEHAERMVTLIEKREEAERKKKTE